MQQDEEQSIQQKYSIWNAFVFSFFSRDLYVDVGKRWKGTGLGYLFLIGVIFTLFTAACFQWAAFEYLPGFVKKIPDFKIEKNVFSTSVEQPYVLEFYGSAIVLDTTGKIKGLDQVPGIEKLKNCILVTKTQFMSRQMGRGDKVSTLSNMPNFSVNQEELGHWADILIEVSGTAYFLIVVTFGYLCRVIILLIYGLLGMLISEILGKGLDYNVALRLAVISHIPPYAITTLWTICGPHLPLQTLWSFLLSTGFLYFAVSSQEGKEPSTEKI
jgi:hypothetical protein